MKVTYTLQFSKAEATRWFRKWKSRNKWWQDSNPTFYTLKRFLDYVDNEALFSEYIEEHRAYPDHLTNESYFQFIADQL